MKISHIVITYNKQDFIAATLDSLLTQSDDSDSEIIIIDDNSSDNTPDIIKQFASLNSKIRYVINTDNKGPSIRFNQGVRLAKNEMIHLVDGDDIVPQNYIKIISSHILKHDVDAVFGSWQKTTLAAEALVSYSFEPQVNISVSNTPLDTILNKKQVRMGMILKRSIFLEAGGCDESIFIQDESLPLRYAAIAKKIMTLSAPVIYVPAGAEQLSKDKSQQHHDRFFAYFNFYNQHKASLSAETNWKLRQALISSTWKSLRKQPLSSKTFSIFINYILSKKFITFPKQATINTNARYFTQLGQTLRRP